MKTLGSNRSVIATLFLLCMGPLLFHLNHLLLRTSVPSSPPDLHYIPTPYHHNSLPHCDTLMQNPSSPLADGAFLTRRTTQVVWKMRADGSRELTLPFTCHLKRYTARQAGQCLTNKSLLFIGDSLTRYQFLSLAYFLEHKRWPKRYHATGNVPCQQRDENNSTACSTPNEPSVCCEYDWESPENGYWPGFIRALGGGMDGSMFHGRMEAKTVRREPVYERYQYVSSEADGRTTISYDGEFGWHGVEPFKGWDFTGCAKNATCRYSREQYKEFNDKRQKKNFDWAYPNTVTAFGSNTTFRAQYQDTNYIFYNRGLWGALQKEKGEIMMEALRNMTGGKDAISNRCFFKSTTGCHRWRENQLGSWEYGDIRNAALNAGCEYLDVSHITKEFSELVFRPYPPPMAVNEYRHIFWDAVHYVSHV